jgi:hypothetical protein
VRQIPGGNDSLWLCVPNHVPDLSFSVQNIDGHEKNSRLCASKIHVDQLDTVGKIDREPVATAQATLCEETSKSIAPDIKFPKRPGLKPGVCLAPFEASAVSPACER